MKRLVCVLMSAVLFLWVALPVHAEEGVTLTWDEATAFALRMDKLSDELQNVDFTPPFSVRHLRLLVQEVTPMFGYEGAVDYPVMPGEFDAAWYVTPNAHVHVMGRSNCQDFTVNASYGNPFSVRFHEAEWVATVVHELVHVQQGSLCRTADAENLENTAEIVSWEVMAAEVNRGNLAFLLPLVQSLRGRAISAVWAVSLREGKSGEWQTFLRLVSNDAIEEARYAKSIRYWTLNPLGLRWLLTAYAEVPLSRVFRALSAEGTYAPYVPSLALPLPPIFSPPFVVTSRGLYIDDLAYFLAHAEDMVSAAVRK